MRRWWRARRGLASLAAPAVLVSLLAGCASMEGLQSDGRARRVKAPVPLWPDYSPAPPGRDENPAALKAVPGVPRIPSGDMTAADALTVLDADFEAEGRTPPAPESVRRPVLHDLTDDGKPDLITVVDLDPRNSELRVYSVRKQRVTRVLALRAVLAGVELAAGHLAIREPTEDRRYVAVTDYVWDGDSMDLWDLTLDEADKSHSSGTGSPSPGGSPDSPPPPGGTASPGGFPSPGSAPSPSGSPPLGGGS
ncbi:hypothetical protein [Streptomyces halobius]|uniref:Lipoprotein n=1 Tax=Streptomyces halobius TaxID=2879846 RepID=A0ABY4MAU0_9ACTN|nr:hypothetical protein [Streptomyces halobius]UQA94808.1 hypothetical protein K9S39_25740 [Streptomyces halobius]